MTTITDLQDRLDRAVGRHVITPAERATIMAGLTPGVKTWEDLPAAVRALVEQIEDRPLA